MLICIFFYYKITFERHVIQVIGHFPLYLSSLLFHKCRKDNIGPDFTSKGCYNKQMRIFSAINLISLQDTRTVGYSILSHILPPFPSLYSLNLFPTQRCKSYLSRFHHHVSSHKFFHSSLRLQVPRSLATGRDPQNVGAADQIGSNHAHILLLCSTPSRHSQQYGIYQATNSIFSILQNITTFSF